VVVASQPAWATIVVSPASFVVDPTSCDASGYTRVTGTLHATATQDAPAFTPSDIVLVATLDGVKNASASARAPIEASYFSILDVQASEATALVAPGEKHGFALKISNFGNDDTRASFELVNASDDAFRVELPPPATLGSKQKGASVIELDTSVKVTAPEGNFLTNRVGTVTVRVVSADAAKPELRGDSATVSFVLTAHATPPGAARKLSPGPPLTGWLAAAGALALASPRRPRSLQR
jgi:hypothetical protein